MERITPLDLERAQLPHAWRGYRTEAVDHLLARLAAQLTTSLAESAADRRRLEDAERRLATFETQERALVESIKLAQQTAEETRAQARREAELILQEARVEAQELRQKAAETAASVEWEIERLRQERTNIEAQLRSFLREHLDRLERRELAVVATIDQEAAAG